MSLPASSKSSLAQPTWVLLALVCAVWVLAISQRSFWLDEVHGAGWKARQTTLAEWWEDDIGRIEKSDSQIAGYVFYIWAYAKVFGSSEWALRAANLPCVLLGFWAWLTVFRNRNPLQWALAATAACSPFLWYYMNEARPYAAQVGALFLLGGTLARLYQWARQADGLKDPGAAPAPEPGYPEKSGFRTRFWLGAFGFGLLMLSASNLLGEIWAMGVTGILLFSLGLKRSLQLALKHWLLCLVYLALLAALGFFYLWTLKYSRGTRGSVDARNLLFIGYELFGFGGFGPGRTDIRSSGLNVFGPFLPWLGLYALVLLPVLWTGLVQVWTSVPRRVLVSVGLGLGAASGFLVMVALATHFKILGRHFTPLLVPVLGLLGCGVGRLWASGSALRRGWAVLFLALSLASCLSLRFAERHAKDDYRTAANLGRAALQAGQTVWWNADERGANFYHLPTTKGTPSPQAAQFFWNPSLAELQQLPLPDLVITSRPDIYDAGNTLTDFLHAQQFQAENNVMAFTVWRRAPASAKP